MDEKELHEIITLHGKWLNHDDGGKQADLREAYLRGADLRWANLREAYLREADLCCVKLSGTDLRGVILSEKIVQVGPIGSRNSYTIYFADRDMVQCGCWNEYRGGSLEQFKVRIDEVYPADTLHPEYRREYLAAIAMFKAMKTA